MTQFRVHSVSERLSYFSLTSESEVRETHCTVITLDTSGPAGSFEPRAWQKTQGQRDLHGTWLSLIVLKESPLQSVPSVPPVRNPAAEGSPGTAGPGPGGRA